MKRIKPKKVKWCARVRMYGDTYEEKILPPEVNREVPTCGIRLFVTDCLGI